MSGTPTMWPIRPIAERPTTSPITAVMMGMPIATIVPNAKLRMIIAAMMPTSSLLSVFGFDSFAPIEPPAATSIPVPFAARSAVSRTLRASRSVRSAELVPSSTGMNAVALSFESPAAPCWLKGLGALTTSGSFARSLAALEMADFCAPASRVPEWTWNTIGLLPFCWGGKRSASTSVARWLSVPGSSRLFEVFEPSVCSAVTMKATSSSHANSTTHLWWAMKKPAR